MNKSTRTLVVLALSSLFGTQLTASEKTKAAKDESKSSAVPAKAASTAPTTPDTSTATPATPLTATVGTQLSTSTAASSSAKPETIISSTPVTAIAPVSPALTSTSVPTIPSLTPSETITASVSTRTSAPTTSTPSDSATSAPDYSIVTSLPTSSLPEVQRHTEQINGLSLLGRLKDATDYQTFSHENYLEKHVKNQTLPVALPTADLQRAKFGHAANELVQKAFNRRDRNTIKRMSRLIRWAETYNIELNEADLTRMKEQAVDQIKDALATLTLLNSKIKTKPTTPTPFDLVGTKKEESKR